MQVSASDATGVKGISVVRDGEVVAQDPQACDYGRTTPCAAPGQTLPSELPVVDTARWADGVHQVVLRVTDAADNATSTAAVAVQTDNTAPGAPANVRNGRGTVWAPRKTQTIRWDVPDQVGAAPVAGSMVRACRKARCVAVVSTGPGEATVRLPGAGTFTGTVTLVDAAGNTAAANAAPLSVGYDAGRPDRPRLGKARRSHSKRVVRVRFRDAGAAPIARLAVRVCAGSTTKRCRGLKPGGVKRVRVRLRRGETTLRVRIVDAAGNRSRERVARLR